MFPRLNKSKSSTKQKKQFEPPKSPFSNDHLPGISKFPQNKQDELKQTAKVIKHSVNSSNLFSSAALDKLPDILGAQNAGFWQERAKMYERAYTREKHKDLTDQTNRSTLHLSSQMDRHLGLKARPTLAFIEFKDEQAENRQSKNLGNIKL